jgi:hypothetical protein
MYNTDLMSVEDIHKLERSKFVVATKAIYLYLQQQYPVLMYRDNNDLPYSGSDSEVIFGTPAGVPVLSLMHDYLKDKYTLATLDSPWTVSWHRTRREESNFAISSKLRYIETALARPRSLSRGGPKEFLSQRVGGGSAITSLLQTAHSRFYTNTLEKFAAGRYAYSSVRLTDAQIDAMVTALVEGHALNTLPLDVQGKVQEKYNEGSNANQRYAEYFDAYRRVFAREKWVILLVHSDIPEHRYYIVGSIDLTCTQSTAMTIDNGRVYSKPIQFVHDAALPVMTPFHATRDLRSLGPDLAAALTISKLYLERNTTDMRCLDGDLMYIAPNYFCAPDMGILGCCNGHGHLYMVDKI